MIIQFNTDKNTDGSDKAVAPYIAQIEAELSRFSDRITRIEVHLSDEDGDKDGPNTKRCVLEARVERRQPMAVTNHANSYGQAIGGALDKLVVALDTIMGKMGAHH